MWILTWLLVAVSSYAITPDFKYVEKRLTKAGFKPSFIKGLKATYEPASYEQVLELNLLLFLKKSDYHGVQVSNDAAETVRRFMELNSGAIKRAEKEHGVRGSVIASLLWIESRHGVNTGYFHVPSAYVHLLQAERPSAIKHLHDNAKKFTDRVTKKARAEITKRTKRKAQWALQELRAIQKMHLADKTTLRTLRGSFAGAFGMAQFIPSSYVRWARSSNKGRPANLVRADDAILSVGYYLKDSGWKKSKPKSHVPALLKYNNSKDYANAILKLSRYVDNGDNPKRLPATDEEDAP